MENFCNLEYCILPPFYDDVIIKGETFQQHMVNVRLVLTKVRESGFTLNALKCKFFQTRIPYLGHVIENGHISLAPDRIKAIIDFPVPNNIHAIRRFIGMTQFCNRFIENLNPILAPLHDSTKVSSPFVWSKECNIAFETVKQMLTQYPVLRSPSDSDHFILETDASDIGIGS